MTEKRQDRKLPTEAEWLEHRDQYIGLCANCGEERECCEPDARAYPCEACHLRAVFGAESYLTEGCTWTDENGEVIITSWVGDFAEESA